MDITGQNRQNNERANQKRMNNEMNECVDYAHQPSSPKVGAADAVLGVGDAARGKNGCACTGFFAFGVTGARIIFRPALGACTESQTDGWTGEVGRMQGAPWAPFDGGVGVLTLLSPKIVLARESGRAMVVGWV